MARNGIHEPPLRVAHVALGLHVGGLEKLLVEFARHADRKRIDLRFVSLGTRGRLADDIEACGWTVTVLDEPPRFRPGLVVRLARLFRQWDVGVVHTHNPKPLLYGTTAARLAGVPGVVHTRHGQHFLAGPRGIAVFRVAARLADRVVCVSQDSARLSAAEGIPRKKLSTVWNGIDVSRFGYAGPRAGGPVVMVGRLSPEKDVETLLRAAALVVHQYPALRVEVAGDGPCLPPLRDLARALGLDRHIEFLGEVRDVPAVLARAAVFVLPSLTEGVSLTLLEAMARGLPVVATRVGGNPEVVADGETGWLVPPAAPAELAAAILRLIADPDEGYRMGLAARRRVERHFDARRMVGEYEALYSELTGRGPGRGGRGDRSDHGRRSAVPKALRTSPLSRSLLYSGSVAT